MLGKKASDMRCWQMGKLFAPTWFTGEGGFSGTNNELIQSTVDFISLPHASALVEIYTEQPEKAWKARTQFSQDQALRPNGK